jgi:hypothetical protein
MSIGADAVDAAIELREQGRESARAIREPRIAIIDVEPAGQSEIGFWISGILDKSKS